MSETLLVLLKTSLLFGTVLIVYWIVGTFVGRSSKAQDLEDETPTFPGEIDAAIRAYGHNTNSIVHAYGGMRFFKPQSVFRKVFMEAQPLVGYVCLDRQNVIIADPLCRPEYIKTVLLEFGRFTQIQNKDLLIFAVGERTARQAAECGFGVIQIGKEPVFDLKTYDASKHDPKILSAVRQAEKKGLKVEEVTFRQIQSDGNLRAALEGVLNEWFKSRKAEKMALLSEVSPFKEGASKKYYVATLNGKTEAFLACSPVHARKGFFIHDLIRKPTALNGVSEALILKSLKSLQEQGYEFASLGIASLAGLEDSEVNQNYPRLNKLLVRTFNKHTMFMNFKALYHFKKKFNPSHEEPAFLCFYPGRFKLSFIPAIASLFSPRGLLGDILFKWRRWSEGTQLPSPLRKLLTSEIAILSRPVPFTFSEFVSRSRFTFLILFLNIYTFMNINGLKEKMAPDSLVQYGFSFESFLHNKWYVLVTSNFMHFDFPHLFGNMLMLLVFVGTLEIIGGTWLAMFVYLFGMNANVPSGLLILPFVNWLHPEAFRSTFDYLDVGASLGIMSGLGALFQFFKHRRRLLSAGLALASMQAVWSRSYFGLDHSVALLIGYGLAYLYLYRGIRRKAYQKLFSTYVHASQHNSAIPFRSRNRKAA